MLDDPVDKIDRWREVDRVFRRGDYGESQEIEDRDHHEDRGLGEDRPVEAVVGARERAQVDEKPRAHSQRQQAHDEQEDARDGKQCIHGGDGG